MKFFKWFWGKKKDDEVFLFDILGNMLMHKKKKMDFESCPFCGEKSISTFANWEMGGNIILMCNRCRVSVIFPNEPKEVSEVKKLWNYRPIEQRLRAENARLKRGK